MGLSNRLLTTARWRWNEARETAGRMIGAASAADEFRQWNRAVKWRRLCFAHDPVIGWRFVPNTRARIFHDVEYYTVRTNAQGFRSDFDFHEVKRARQRWVVLGDSYTAGDGVSNSERFTELIAGAYPDVEICNLGMPGTGLDQQVLIQENIGHVLRPDAYILCTADVDIFRLTVKAWPAIEWGTRAIRYRAKPYFTLKDGELICHNAPVPRGTRSESELENWGPVDFLKAKTREDWMKAVSATSITGQLTRALLQRFVRNAQGVPVFLAPLPSPHTVVNHRETGFQDAFKELHDVSRGCVFLDVVTPFLALKKKQCRDCFFSGDPHFSRQGHQFVAELIGKQVSAVSETSSTSTAHGSMAGSCRE